jgi:micrococcal nuclease
MRFTFSVLSVCLVLFLFGCPRRTSEVDGGTPDVDAFYDPGVGNGFTGDVALDDARVMAIDPSTLRSGATQCRAPILARVLRVVDGDTMHVMGISETLPDADVRFIGVNAPEIAHMAGEVADCYGNDATLFTNQLNGHLVWLTFDIECTDPYSRMLAYVHIGAGDGDMWQRQLVRRGYARATEFPPNSTYATAFTADQTIAQSEGAGLWSACP